MLNLNVPVQESLFKEHASPERQRVVNVASVKQRSPFRYPGGKTWLVPEVTLWLSQKNRKPGHFVELFAGGGIVGLTVAAEGLADHVTMIELDPDVASVWRTIFSDDAEWLARRILAFDLTSEHLQETLSRPTATTRDKRDGGHCRIYTRPVLRESQNP